MLPKHAATTNLHRDTTAAAQRRAKARRSHAVVLPKHKPLNQYHESLNTAASLPAVHHHRPVFRWPTLHTTATQHNTTRAALATHRGACHQRRLRPDVVPL